MSAAIRLPYVSVALAGCALAALALPEGLQDALALSRAPLTGGALWQLWSGHLMHFGATHALTDLLALCCAAVLVEADLGSRRTLLLYFGAAPLISLTTLLAAPHLVAYRGASALAVTLCFAAAERLWRDRHLRAPLLLIAAAFTAKLACDAWGLQTDLSGLPAGIAVAWQAHVAGAVIGLILALIPQVRRRAPNATA